MAAIPAAAHINCFDRNAYSDPNRSRAITADAENTITNPTNTRSMVTVNSQRSTLTRFAMGVSFHHASGDAHGRIADWRSLAVACLGSGSRCRPRGQPSRPCIRGSHPPDLAPEPCFNIATFTRDTENDYVTISHAIADDVFTHPQNFVSPHRLDGLPHKRFWSAVKRTSMHPA